MLKNKALDAKIGADTDENEPLFSWIQWHSMFNIEDSIHSLGRVSVEHRARPREQ